MYKKNKKKDDRRYTLRLPADLDKNLKEYTEKTKLTAQQAIREALKKFLK